MAVQLLTNDSRWSKGIAATKLALNLVTQNKNETRNSAKTNKRMSMQSEKENQATTQNQGKRQRPKSSMGMMTKPNFNKKGIDLNEIRQIHESHFYKKVIPQKNQQKQQPILNVMQDGMVQRLHESTQSLGTLNTATLGGIGTVTGGGTMNGSTFIQPQMNLSINNYNFAPDGSRGSVKQSISSANPAFNHSILEEQPSEQYEEIVFDNEQYYSREQPPIGHQRIQSILTNQEERPLYPHFRTNSQLSQPHPQAYFRTGSIHSLPTANYDSQYHNSSLHQQHQPYNQNTTTLGSSFRSSHHRLSIYERQQIWEQSKQNKIKRQRESKILEEVQDCTFKPQRVTLPDEQQQQQSVMVLGEITMTTNNSDEDVNLLENNPQRDSNQIDYEGNFLKAYGIARERKRSRGSMTLINHQQEKHIQKHVARLSIPKLRKELDTKLNSLQPGSGQLWNGQITLPQPPNITGYSRPNSQERRPRSAIGQLNSGINTSMLYLEDANASASCIIDSDVKSIHRSISPSCSAYLSQKRRHSYYPKTDKSLERPTNEKLQFYQSKLQSLNTQSAVLENLISMQRLHKNSSLNSQAKIVKNDTSIRQSQIIRKGNGQTAKSSIANLSATTTQGAENQIYCEEDLNRKIVGAIHQFIQALEI